MCQQNNQTHQQNKKCVITLINGKESENINVKIMCDKDVNTHKETSNAYDNKGK